jgi:5-hydroxyisourate hydrolase-like protein (transthyretin family)
VGKTLDSGSGVPVANATVSWEPAGSPPGPAAMAARLLDGGGANVTSTDADGRFSFDGLPEGKITLTATHPDYLEATRDFDGDPGMEVQIPLGSGGSITGVVVGSDGTTPVPQAQVRLDDEGETGGLGPASQTASADGGGGFQFAHLGAGRFRLTAQSDRGTSTPKEVILAANQRQDGVLLQVSAGTLLDGTVSGLPAGQLGQVRVTAAGAGYRDSAVTDDSGRFTLHDVPSGVITLTASTALLQGRTTSKTVEIPAATAEMPVEIVFEGFSRLSGRVTRSGSPLSGLFLLALPDPPDGSGRFTGQTDEAGRYALEGMSDGNYQVSVNGAGVSYRKSFAVSGDTNGDIALPSTTLTGTVVDAGSGEPIDGATVQAETGQETQAQAVKRGQTDSTGAYEIADLDPGNYQVTARKAGYQLKTQSATVGGDVAPLDFSLLKGSGASIRVADGLTGIPLGGVNALAFGSDGSVAFQGAVALDSTGTGEIPSLAPGRYAVYVFSGGYAPRSIGAMDVPTPGPVPVSMTPGGSVEARSTIGLTGRILDGSGAPYLLNGFRLDGVVTVMPPVTVWQHLAPGDYTLFAVSADGNRSLPFTVAEGQTTQLIVK